MWQNDTAGSTKIKKGRKRESKQESERKREREKGEHSVFVCDFLLIFSTLYSKAKVKWNGCPAEGRSGMGWDGIACSG